MIGLKIAKAAALASSLVVFAGEARANAPTRDERQIAELMDRFAAAMSNKDIDGAMKAYVPDESYFLFDVVTPRQFVGTASLRRRTQDNFASTKGPIAFSISDLSITTDGTLAFSHCLTHQSGSGIDGKAYDVTWRTTNDFRKIKGHWYIVMEHDSVPIDLATGKPDFASRP